ncbi:MAG: hypothetical protein ACK42K_08050, partial [Leptonema sp. (in: bacteria)]
YEIAVNLSDFCKDYVKIEIDFANIKNYLNKRLNEKKLSINDFIEKHNIQNIVSVIDKDELFANILYTKNEHEQTIKEQLERNKKRREEAGKLALNVLEESLYKVETDWIRYISTPVLKEIQEKIHLHSRKRLENLFEGHLKHLSNRDKRILYDWAIKFHREMNRIHRVGIEKILHYYYKESRKV